ncbi:MAG: hypothetical protein JO040_05270, partial [Gemmatimonadetes bacterium]|nr:hypothetical protein [Gemmatimonadota bacterium]
ERQEGRRAQDFGAPPAPVAPSLGPERNLLLLFLRDESWLERAVRDVGPEDFRYPVYRTLYEKLIELEGNRDADGAWLEAFPPEVLPVLEELRGDPEAAEIGDAEAYFQANLHRLLARPFEERLTEIEREMTVATPEQQALLLQETRQITAMMRERGLLKKSGILRNVQNAGRNRSR